VPATGQCATTSSLTIAINSFLVPSGDSNQSFNANSTIADIIVSPQTLVWHATSQDAVTNSN
jgi:hypothetical protein